MELLQDILQLLSRVLGVLLQQGELARGQGDPLVRAAHRVSGLGSVVTGHSPDSGSQREAVGGGRTGVSRCCRAGGAAAAAREGSAAGEG